MAKKTPLIDFESQIQYWVHRVSFMLRKEIHGRFLAEGLNFTAEEMALLIQLWDEPGQTPSMLADKTIRDRTTVTRLLDGMVKKGLVEREVDPGDRRRVIVKPTSNSVKLQATIVPVVKGLIQDSMDGISEIEVENARNVLRKLAENLQAMRT